jgi:hypothetical protein
MGVEEVEGIEEVRRGIIHLIYRRNCFGGEW